MRKLMKLRGRIKKQDKLQYFQGFLLDGTPFDLMVGEHDIESSDPTQDESDGYLFVTMEGKQDDKCYLTLPKPSIV